MNFVVFPSCKLMSQFWMKHCSLLAVMALTIALTCPVTAAAQISLSHVLPDTGTIYKIFIKSLCFSSIKMYTTKCLRGEKLEIVYKCTVQPLGNRMQSHPIKMCWWILFFLPQSWDFNFYVGVVQRLTCENPHGEAGRALCITAELSPSFRSRSWRAGS